MNTLHLKYAVEVEKTGSITRAADNLYMGQPSLSKAIKELEDDLQIEIFRRSSKGMVPTEEGAEFLRYAKNILSQIQNMERISHRGMAGSGTISLCLPASGYLLGAVASFGQEATQAGVKLEVAELDSKEILERVAEGKCDFGVLRFPEMYESYFAHYCQNKDLKMEDIWTFDQVVVCNKDMEGEYADLTELACKDFLTSGYEWEDEMELPQGIKLEINGFYNALAFLSENPKAYLKSEPLAKSLCERFGLAVEQMEASIRWKDVLLYSQNHKFSDLQHKLVNKIYEWKNKVSLERSF